MKLSKELKIGLVTIVTIAFLVWGLNFLKGKDILKSSDEYYAIYDNIDGLLESGVVYLNGYRVGTVSSIKFYKNNIGKIIVEYSMEEKISIPKNSIALIYSASVVSGIKDIKLILSDSPEIMQPGDTLIGILDKGAFAQIDPIKEKFESALNKIDTLLYSINDILNETTRKNLKKSIANIAQVTDEIKNSGEIASTLENLNSITLNLKQSNDELKNILSNFSSFSDTLKQLQIKQVVEHTNQTLKETTILFHRINEGKGTLGALAGNDTLYQNLKNASENLNLLLEDLRKNPGRYIQVSVFGKKEKDVK